MAARAREMGWLRKVRTAYFQARLFLILLQSKLLYLALTITWDIVPVLVSLLSFSAFVLLAQGQLTVAVAFPALQTFGLLTRALTLVGGINEYRLQARRLIAIIDPPDCPMAHTDLCIDYSYREVSERR